MRSVPSSTRILKPEYFSAIRRDEYQLEVISFLTLNFRACLCASLSLSPTAARGGIAKTTVGIPRYCGFRRTEGPSERFLIAYSDEESLRELIAGPSIIACGFASREEAQTNIDADFWTAAAWKQTLSGPTVDGIEKYQRGVSAKRRLGSSFNLTQTGRIVRGQAAVAGAILICYSRNAVSTVFRSFVVG